MRLLAKLKKILYNGVQSHLKVSPQGFKSARTDDASFSNVRALADASSCKPANKSTI